MDLINGIILGKKRYVKSFVKLDKTGKFDWQIISELRFFFFFLRNIPLAILVLKGWRER